MSVLLHSSPTVSSRDTFTLHIQHHHPYPPIHVHLRNPSHAFNRYISPYRFIPRQTLPPTPSDSHSHNSSITHSTLPRAPIHPTNISTNHRLLLQGPLHGHPPYQRHSPLPTHPIRSPLSTAFTSRFTTQSFWHNIAPETSDTDSESESDSELAPAPVLPHPAKQAKTTRRRIRRVFWHQQRRSSQNIPYSEAKHPPSPSGRNRPSVHSTRDPDQPLLHQPCALTSTTNFPYGDLMLQKPSTCYRLISQNINRISYDTAGGDLQEICSTINLIGADIANFQEVNLETRNYQVNMTIEKLLTRQWSTSKSYVASTSQVHVGSLYKPGGTMILSNGPLSYRVTGHSTDAYGRWCTTNFALKNKEILTVISAYQVCQTSVASAGSKTAFVQQTIMHRLKNNPDNPRTNFVKDIRTLLQSLLQLHHKIIITGDFNEYLSTQSAGLKQVFVDNDLIDPVQLRHGLAHEVPTYARGRRRVDYMFVSSSIIPYIKSCGYDPFNEHICSDHRMMFLDIDKSLFATEISAIKPPSQRGIRGNDACNIQVYIPYLHRLCIDQNLFTKMATINALPLPDDALIEQLDAIFSDVLNSADKRCIKRFDTPYSPKLQKLRVAKNIFRMCLHEITCKKNMQPQIDRLQKLLPHPVVLPSTRKEASSFLHQANADLKHTIANSAQERKDHLQQLSDLYATESKSFASKSLRQLIKAEETKRLFNKLKYLRKRHTKSRLTRVLIPTNPSSDPSNCTEWTAIDDPQEMESLILQRNQQHFGQAAGTPFASPPLSDDVDFSTESPNSDVILCGEYNAAELDEMVQHTISHLRAIDHLQCPTLQLSTSQFTNRLKSWAESTSTSPSGRHLGHYMALVKPHGVPDTQERFDIIETQRSAILQIHLCLINYCLRFGYSLNRWKSVVNVMIEKEPGNPKLHRLRVIHIYEADYNLMLSVKHRELIHSLTDNVIINPGIYSNRPGMNAQDPVFLEELQNEYNRLTRSMQIKMDVDAESCYDRIVPSLAMLLLRKYGMHKNVCIVQGRTLREVQYKLKTGLGTPTSSYRHSLISPIYGTGQGSASSPVIWLVILNHLMECHDELSHGASYTNYTADNSIKINVVGFVDDCSCQVNNHGDQLVSNATLLSLMAREAQMWRDLLQVSGGELSPNKCSYHFTYYSFSSSGTPCLTVPSNDPSIVLQLKNASQVIRHLSPFSTHKTLGCYKSPSGNNEFKLLKSKSDTIGSAIWGSSCTKREVWTYYFAIYLPSITYSLPLTAYTKTQLQEIQRKSTHIFVPMLGHNRNTNLAIVYGPATYGGMGLRDLPVEQSLGQLQKHPHFFESSCPGHNSTPGLVGQSYGIPTPPSATGSLNG